MNNHHFGENNAGYYEYRHESFIPPLRIVSVGNARWGGNRRYSRSKSEMFGIELVTDGDCNFSQDGKSYLVKPGSVYLLRRGCKHTYCVGPSGYLHKRYMVIEGAGLEPLLRTLTLSECDVIVPRSCFDFVKLCKAIFQVLKQKKSGFTVELSLLAYKILLELGQSITELYPDPVRAALEFIQQNVKKPLTSVQICERSGLSMTHFNRLFRQFTGVSPMQFFISQRMSWAQHLLRQTSMSIKEISSQVGYDDPLYFSSQFRKWSGESPKFFRSKEPTSPELSNL